MDAQVGLRQEAKQKLEDAVLEFEQKQEQCAQVRGRLEELGAPVKLLEEQLEEAEAKGEEEKVKAKEMTEALQKANKELAILKKKLEEGIATREEVDAAEESKKTGAQVLLY